MENSLRDTASKILTILNKIPVVKKCTVYGSLADDTFDELSDIDIKVDVSGYDNGQFMLELVELLKERFCIYYSDYAPSLVPDKYIVSVAIDRNNPFLIVDLWCRAEPHCTTVSKQQVLSINEKYSHMLKLWTANLKHYVRGVDCYDDIVRMAKRVVPEEIDSQCEVELLEKTLCWLEENAENELCDFVESCRRRFDELVN